MAAQAQLVLGSSIALPLLRDEHHHVSSAVSLRLGCTRGLHRYSLSCHSSWEEVVGRGKKRNRNGNGLLQGRERKGMVCMALGDNNPSPAQPQVYQGIYGPWSVDSLDIREVVLYRTGLVTAATTFIAAGLTAFLPDDNVLKSLLQGLYDPLYVVGAGGLGMALFLIHIYVTPIKRTLQALWAVGVLGSLGVAVNFAAPENQGLVTYVVEHPAAIWAVGPLFASLTGLVFKEGLCYGKLEAAALFFVIPSVLLGRLSELMDEKVQLGLLVAWMGLFAVFASRKFTQSIKDDIGDKSVFIFNALPEDSKQELLSRLQQQQQPQQRDRTLD